jgi:hypothetical protein
MKYLVFSIKTENQILPCFDRENQILHCFDSENQVLPCFDRENQILHCFDSENQVLPCFDRESYQNNEVSGFLYQNKEVSGFRSQNKEVSGFLYRNHKILLILYYTLIQNFYFYTSFRNSRKQTISFLKKGQAGKISIKRGSGWENHEFNKQCLHSIIY